MVILLGPGIYVLAYIINVQRVHDTYCVYIKYFDGNVLTITYIFLPV